MQTNALALTTGVADAARSKPSLLVAGLSASGALAFPSWTWFLVASASYAALFTWGLVRHGSVRALMRELNRNAALPDPTDFADPLARQFIYRLAHARAQTRRVMRRHGRSLKERLNPHVQRLTEIEERVIALVHRLDDMSGFLATKSLRAIESEIERFRRAAAAARTETLAAQYDRARLALEEELGALRDIAAGREVVIAKLETLTGTMEMFPSQVVRLAVLDAHVADDDDEAWCDPRTFVADTRAVDELLASGWERAPRPALPAPEA